MQLELSNFEYVALGALGVLAVLLILTLIRRRRRAPAPAAPAGPEVIAFLEHAGGDGPRLYALHKPLVVVGRGSDSDIRILADVPGALSVSRRHAQIRREDMDFIVEDLGSQNGIRVNGLVTHRNLLRDGYRVSFGSVEFVFHLSKSDDAARRVV